MFDEVSYLLSRYVESAVKEGKQSIKMISSDTDLFVLLCSMYLYQSWWDVEIYIKHFNIQKNLISIRLKY